MLERDIIKLRITGVLQFSLRQGGPLNNIKVQPNPETSKPIGPRLQQPHDSPEHSVPPLNRHRHPLHPGLHQLYGLRNETDPLPPSFHRCS
jgi:hypothetical protein